MKTIVAMTLRSSQIAQVAAELRVACDGNPGAGLTAQFDRAQSHYIFSCDGRYQLILVVVDNAGEMADLSCALRIANQHHILKEEVRFVAHTLQHRDVTRDPNSVHSENEYGATLLREVDALRRSGIPAGYIHHPSTRVNSPEARRDENLVNYFVLLDLVDHLKRAVSKDIGEPAPYFENAWDSLQLPRK